MPARNGRSAVTSPFVDRHAEPGRSATPTTPSPIDLTAVLAPIREGPLCDAGLPHVRAVVLRVYVRPTPRLPQAAVNRQRHVYNGQSPSRAPDSQDFRDTVWETRSAGANKITNMVTAHLIMLASGAQEWLLARPLCKANHSQPSICGILILD